jgi:hypothetical protein
VRALLFPLGASLVVGLLAPAALGRQVPAPGGRASVALPAELFEATRRAHVYTPVFEPVLERGRAALLAQPPVAGLDDWRSEVLARVAANADSRVWTLTPRGVTAATLAVALEACLNEPARGATSWPSSVLSALELRPAIKSDGSVVTLRFPRSVGVVPELLGGCLLEVPEGGPTGPYTAVASNLLAARASFRGPPLLGVIELRELGSPADMHAGSPQSGAGAALLAPFPDVIALVQSEGAREKDPFGFKRDEGWASFHRGLGADLLLAVYWAGRGRAAEDLLPPGVAPARPLPESRPLTTSSPLVLMSLDGSAPRVPLRFAVDDALIAGVSERLAVLLRSRGYAVDPGTPRGSAADDGVQVLRWRAPTTDPALALLAMAGAHPTILVATPAELLADKRLLSARAEERLAAALLLERHWLTTRVVVPLMTADHWFGVDPGLRGVRVRPDGVPLLDDAYWGGRE